MYAIHSYTNTKCELEIAKTRLKLLTDRKKKLYCSYFPLTSEIKEVNINSKKKDSNNKMTNYLHELYDVIDIGTGLSLADEIKKEEANVQQLKKYIDDMGKELSKLNGIEYQLFYEIVYKGTPISRSVEIIANKHNIEVQTVWKNYYRKIKKDIKKISKFISKIQ